jgi:hypothetical protein
MNMHIDGPISRASHVSQSSTGTQLDLKGQCIEIIIVEKSQYSSIGVPMSAFDIIKIY